MFLVGSGVLITNKNNEILLIKRTDNNTWGIPGGSLELGETFEEAAVREAYEETGLRVENLKLFEVFSGKEGHHIYPNGDEVYNTVCIFETKKYSGEVKPDKYESKDVKFFDVANLPNDINPTDIRILNKFKNKI